MVGGELEIPSPIWSACDVGSMDRIAGTLRYSEWSRESLGLPRWLDRKLLPAVTERLELLTVNLKTVNLIAASSMVGSTHCAGGGLAVGPPPPIATHTARTPGLDLATSLAPPCLRVATRAGLLASPFPVSLYLPRPRWGAPFSPPLPASIRCIQRIGRIVSQLEHYFAPKNPNEINGLRPYMPPLTGSGALSANPGMAYFGVSVPFTASP